MSERDGELSFAREKSERVISTQTWVIAFLAVLLVLVVAAVTTLRRSPDRAVGAREPDPYAASLPLSSIALAEATNGAGGKLIYVDGVIRNSGTKTLQGALIQVTFAAADGSAPYRETVPLELIRTREPYVDLQPVSAHPLAPGQSREFRLIFETVPATWDVKQPQIRIVHADLK